MQLVAVQPGWRRRTSLGGERGVQVFAGVGIVRLESQGFLELADRLAGAALLVEGGAEIIVSFGVVGSQAQGLLEVADSLVDLPSPARARWPRLLWASA